MKKLMLLLLVPCCIACTENERAKRFGGVMQVSVPCGERVYDVTWKETELWYATEPMGELSPRTTTFREKSSFGAWEGKIIFKEARCIHH